MLQVVSPIKTVQKILGQQKAEEGTPYRLSVHCMRVERPEGVLLYHTLTGELLLLSHGEAEQLAALPGPVPPELAALVPRWFLRPEAADDMALADQTRKIAARFGKKETALTKYTIFTTLECNARCFYCFETGWKKSSMSEQTALDTAGYIAAHCGGKPVRLYWFGGEPLVNVRAIDIITDRLRQEGVEFHSAMVSNGYLFDETLVQRARADWNLRQVQITLDGTEEVYNRRKAYVNSQGSPYQRVLRNIGLLLDADIQVKVRLNMDKDNEEDLYALLDELAERFGGSPRFDIFQEVLYENMGNDPTSYTEKERCSYAKMYQSLRTYANEKGIGIWETLKPGIVTYCCVADDARCTTVTPMGLLGRCYSCVNGTIWGSIYSDEVDEEVFRQWQEHKPPEEGCKNCSLYPRCVRLRKCPVWQEHCSPIEQARREDRLIKVILGSYEEWKAGQSAQTGSV